MYPKDYCDEAYKEEVLEYTCDDLAPLYRSYHGSSVDHFYTIDENEKNNLVGAGWGYEGIAGFVFKSWVPGSVKLYRLYHPT